MSADTTRPGAHDAVVQVRGYVMVFATLMALTVVTVAVARFQLPVGPAVVVGLTIAGVKAALVASVFMHLRHERPLVLATLAVTAAVAVSLIGITLWTEAGHAPGTQFIAPFAVPESASPEETH